MSQPAAPLTLYLHPFASYCQKVLVALYENATPFEAVTIDLGNPAARETLQKLWPMTKFPVLRDTARDRTIPEACIIIEYLALHYPGPVPLLPADADQARETRLRDRFYDLYVAEPMSKIVTDRLRPQGRHDPFGVAQARAQLHTACGLIERDMASRSWTMGETFSLADCAAAPALFYANLVQPLRGAYPHTAAYLDRLLRRPSFARVVREAQPYMPLFPNE